MPGNMPTVTHSQRALSGCHRCPSPCQAREYCAGMRSSEILKIVDTAFLPEHKLVVGVEPTYETVYRYVTNSKAKAIRVGLTETYDTDIKGIIRVTKLNARDVGVIYLCNPNNPTGRIVSNDDIKLLLDSVPADIPVFIDEAYHHFVDDPRYETSIVQCRRQVWRYCSAKGHRIRIQNETAE